MRKEITLIMYSHTSYSDVWVPFFKQAARGLMLMQNYPDHVEDLPEQPFYRDLREFPLFKNIEEVP